MRAIRTTRLRGVTLIELLVVMGLVILLAAVTLPTVRNMLKDQKTTEAARMLQGFLESARAKAIASNRPVAAILERMGTTNTDTVGLATCTRLSLGEVFPPYEGDWSSAGGTLGDASPTDGFADYIDIPLAQASALMSLVTEGDFIQLGNRNIGFSITGASLVSGNTAVRVAFTNQRKHSGAAIEEARWPLTAGATNIPFRIFRKPSKTMASAITLPRGTCVDLGWSGFGPTGTEFASSTATWDSRRSIFIVFNARGSIDSMYEFQQELAGTATNIPAFAMPLGQLHMLIGRIDQVDTSGGAVSTRDDFQPNHTDTANKWVSVNTYNGLIHTSDVGSPSSATPLLSSRALAISHSATKD